MLTLPSHVSLTFTLLFFLRPCHPGPDSRLLLLILCNATCLIHPATEQPSVATDSSLTATEHAISHNAGGGVDVITSTPMTKQLLTNLHVCNMCVYGSSGCLAATIVRGCYSSSRNTHDYPLCNAVVSQKHVLCLTFNVMCCYRAGVTS